MLGFFALTSFCTACLSISLQYSQQTWTREMVNAHYTVHCTCTDTPSCRQLCMLASSSPRNGISGSLYPRSLTKGLQSVANDSGVWRCYRRGSYYILSNCPTNACTPAVTECMHCTAVVTSSCQRQWNENECHCCLNIKQLHLNQR